MIITCDECSTRFRLDESLLKDEGSKVRCSLCKHVFTAFPPAGDALLDMETPAQPDMDTPPITFGETGQKDQDKPSWERTSDSSGEDLLDFDDTDFDDDLDQGKAQADIEISFEDSDTDFDMENGLSFEEEDTSGSPDLTFDEKEITFDEADITFDEQDGLETVDTQSRQDSPAEIGEEAEELDGIDFETLEPDSLQEPADDDQFSVFDEDLETKEDISLGLELEAGDADKTQDMDPEQTLSDPSREDLEPDEGMEFDLEKEFLKKMGQ